MECQQNMGLVINHWAQNCPDRNTYKSNKYILNKDVLHQTNYDNPQELKFHVSEI